MCTVSVAKYFVLVSSVEAWVFPERGFHLTGIIGWGGKIKKQGQSGFIIFPVSKILGFLYCIYNMYILYHIALCNISNEFMYIITEMPSKGGISLILQCRNRLEEGKGLV